MFQQHFHFMFKIFWPDSFLITLNNYTEQEIGGFHFRARCSLFQGILVGKPPHTNTLLQQNLLGEYSTCSEDNCNKQATEATRKHLSRYIGVACFPMGKAVSILALSSQQNQADRSINCIWYLHFFQYITLSYGCSDSLHGQSIKHKLTKQRKESHHLQQLIETPQPQAPTTWDYPKAETSQLPPQRQHSFAHCSFCYAHQRKAITNTVYTRGFPNRKGLPVS